MRKYVGSNYVWWLEGDSCYGNNGPFYAYSGAPPSVEKVMAEGVCCAGIINIACRIVGYEIPGVSEKYEGAGGTYIWEEHLNEKKVLTKIGDTIPPEGSILLLPYEDTEQQGHMALMLENGMVLHSYTNTSPGRGKSGPGAVVEPFEKVMEIFNFKYAVLPEKWIPSAFSSE